MSTVTKACVRCGSVQCTVHSASEFYGGVPIASQASRALESEIYTPRVLFRTHCQFKLVNDEGRRVQDKEKDKTQPQVRRLRSESLRDPIQSARICVCVGSFDGATTAGSKKPQGRQAKYVRVALVLVLDI